MLGIELRSLYVTGSLLMELLPSLREIILIPHSFGLVNDKVWVPWTHSLLKERFI